MSDAGIAFNQRGRGLHPMAAVTDQGCLVAKVTRLGPNGSVFIELTGAASGMEGGPYEVVQGLVPAPAQGTRVVAVPIFKRSHDYVIVGTLAG